MKGTIKKKEIDEKNRSAYQHMLSLDDSQKKKGVH